MSRQQNHDGTDSSDAFSLSLAPFITTSPANGNNTVGIIIVPATRSVASLSHSINLAATSNTPIVVIVSHGIDSREVEQAIEQARATGCVLR